MTQGSAGTGPQFREVGNGCRIIDASPSDVRGGRLQKLIDTVVAGRPSEDSSSRVTICLQPGRYELQQPITLCERHSNLTLRGCPEAAVISAAPGFDTAFGPGLVVLAGANNVTITGLELELPHILAALARVRASRQQDKAFAAAVNDIDANGYVSIDIRPVHCAALTITSCLFQFSLGVKGTTSGAAPKPGAVFGVGVFAASDCADLQLQRNQFLCDRAPSLDVGRPQHALAGYLLTLAAVAPAGGKNAFRQFNGSQVGALLRDADIGDNTFDSLSSAAVFLADLGTIRTWGNIIRRSYAGIWLVDATAAALTDLGGTFSVLGELKDQDGAVRAALTTGLLDPVLLPVTVFGRTCPLPDLGTIELATLAVDPADMDKLQAGGKQARHEWMTRFVNDVAAGLTPARPSRRRTTKATAPDTIAAATANFNQGIGGEEALLAQGNPFQQQLRVANAGLAALARLHDAVAQSELTSRIERNDIECGLEQLTRSGPATFVYASPTGWAHHLGRGDHQPALQYRRDTGRRTPVPDLPGNHRQHRRHDEREGDITGGRRLPARRDHRQHPHRNPVLPANRPSPCSPRQLAPAEHDRVTRRTHRRRDS